MNTQPHTPDTTTTDSPDTPPPSPTPPKGPRIWVLCLVSIAISIGFVAGAFFGKRVLDAINAAIDSRTSSKAEGNAASSDSSDDQHATTFYTCGMHPWVILPEDGICPICHMDLEPIDPDKFTGTITIDPVVTQNIGVRIAPVTKGPLVRTIRTVGSLEYDETRVRDVNIKVPGWIESLFVDALGQHVNKGDPLFTYYSPELYAAQDEYLLALKSLNNQQATADEGFDNFAADATSLLNASRTKLEYYDITEAQIKELEARGTPAKSMTMLSPFTGIVTAKHANEGMRVDLGMRVYQIADLSKIWVMVSLYEYQLPFIEEGQQAIMTLPYIPGKTFTGTITYIYPYLDPKTRQINVRLEFDNPDNLLKPGMFASIELKSTLSEDRTLAPRSAIIDTGTQQVALVSLGEGRFEPRDVTMGVETDNDMVEIIDGLKPGDMVVTSGQFLLDSEARVRDALAKMIRGDQAAAQPAVVQTARAPQAAGDAGTIPAHAQSMLADMLDAYFIMQEALASDDTEPLSTPAQHLADKAQALHDMHMPGMDAFSQRFNDDLTLIASIARQLASTTDLKEARNLFYDISLALTRIAETTGVPPTVKVQVQKLHCPMYKGGQGGSTWLQPAGSVKNPYMGSKMLECFDERSALPVAGGDDK